MKRTNHKYREKAVEKMKNSKIIKSRFNHRKNCISTDCLKNHFRDFYQGVKKIDSEEAWELPLTIVTFEVSYIYFKNVSKKALQDAARDCHGS